MQAGKLGLHIVSDTFSAHNLAIDIKKVSINYSYIGMRIENMAVASLSISDCELFKNDYGGIIIKQMH